MDVAVADDVGLPPVPTSIAEENRYRERRIGYFLFLVRLGGRTIETLHTFDSLIARRWFRHVTRGPQKSLPSPRLAAICCFRGPQTFCPHFRILRPREIPDTCLRAVVLCLGGSHRLIYAGAPYGEVPAVSSLQSFLEDRRVTVVGLGIERDARMLREEWGIRVANPVELRRVEEMASVAMGFHVAKKPKLVAETWGKRWPYEDTEGYDHELIMYAARDASLIFEVGAHCLKKIGRQL